MFAPVWNQFVDVVVAEAVIKLHESRSEKFTMSIQIPSSNDCESGKAISVKLEGVVWPP